MSDRRRALRWLFAGSASLGLPWSLARAGQSGDDPEWLVTLAARDVSAFLDVRAFSPDGSPFRKASNLLAALTADHGFPLPRVGVAFAASASAIGHLLGPAAWTAYPIGETLARELAPEHGAALRANAQTWGDAGSEGARDLRARGVRILACQNTLKRWSRDFAQVSGETPDAVRARLQGALHEGVELVPAAIAAAVIAQRRGLSYVAIS